MMKLTEYRLVLTVPAGETSVLDYFAKPIRGIVRAIEVEFTNSTPPSSSDRDVNIYEMNPFDDDDINDALQELLNIGTLGAAPADDNGVYYPNTYAQDETGLDLTYDATRKIPTPFVLYGRKIGVSVTAAAEGDITTIKLIVEER